MNKVYKLINHKRIENILNHCLFFSAIIITVSHVFLTKIISTPYKKLAPTNIY